LRPDARLVTSDPGVARQFAEVFLVDALDHLDDAVAVFQRANSATTLLKSEREWKL